MAKYRTDTERWNAKRDEFNAKHPELVERCRRKKQYAASIKWRYGMSQADYDYILRLQRGRCAICRRTAAEAKMPYLAIDHCHQTGRTRGLLCHRCNLTLGTIRENPSRVRHLKVDPAVAEGFLDYIERRCAVAVARGSF